MPEFLALLLEFLKGVEVFNIDASVIIAHYITFPKGTICCLELLLSAQLRAIERVGQ
jgi:hypothetical protein